MREHSGVQRTAKDLRAWCIHSLRCPRLGAQSCAYCFAGLDQGHIDPPYERQVPVAPRACMAANLEFSRRAVRFVVAPKEPAPRSCGTAE